LGAMVVPKQHERYLTNETDFSCRDLFPYFCSWHVALGSVETFAGANYCGVESGEDITGKRFR